MHRLCETACGGQSDAAHEIDRSLQPLHRNLFLESNPIPVKWAVHRMGLIGPTIRLPLTELSAQFHNDVIAAMDSADVSHD